MTLYSMLQRAVFATALLAAPATGLVACDDDHDHDHGAHGEDPDEEACDHGEFGPFSAVTAIDAADASTAPNVVLSHTVAQVDTSGLADGGIAYVTMVIDKAGDWYLYSSVGADITLFDAASAEVTVEDSTTTPCTDYFPLKQTYELEIGTYLAAIGPLPAGTTGFDVFATHVDADHDHD